MSAKKSVDKKVSVTIDLTYKDIDDELTTAFESGIAYWARVTMPRGKPQWEAVIHDIEGDDGKKYRLSMKKMVEGIAICAKKYPRHFGDFISQTGDAITADVIVQCAVFGEIVYG